MVNQLDILALEPFYGGARKSMLESVMRHSRHRWTLLKLPPRRIERRLAAAAHWFAEQLSRHWVGRVDVLFTSEAMNLADLVRLVPELQKKPRVVYFHDNQLPPVGSAQENALTGVNLATATAASEIWFNTHFHLKTFLKRAAAFFERHPELSGRHLPQEFAAKAQVMAPPVDQSLSQAIREREAIARDPRLIFVDTRDANMQLLNEGLGGLYRRGEKYNLVTVGPVDGLDENLPRRTVSERDEEAQIRALHEAAVLVSARPGAPYDHYAVRALQLGCWPIFPSNGFYPELLPQSLHSLCLYDSTVDKFVNQMQNVWWVVQPKGYEEELSEILSQFDSMRACEAMDDRLEQLVVMDSLKSSSS